MLYDTRVVRSGVAFVSSDGDVFLGCEVELWSEIVERTSIRPRRNGPWVMRVTQAGREICRKELGVDFDWAHAAFEAIRRHVGNAGRACEANAPALAGWLPAMEVTGLSCGVGGWVAGQPRVWSDGVYPGSFGPVQRRSREELERRMAQREIAVRELPTVFEQAVALSPEAFTAMLLGVEIGDSLGAQSESMRASERAQRFGWIEQHRHRGRDDSVFSSDDTQMSARVLSSQAVLGRLELADVVRRWRHPLPLGMGSTVGRALSALDSLPAGADPWAMRQTVESASNGALMRVAGLIALHATSQPALMVPDLLLGSAVTHDCSASNAACAGWAALLLALANKRSRRASRRWDFDSWAELEAGTNRRPATRSILAVREPRDVIEVFLSAARPVEDPEARLRSRVPGDAYFGSLCDFVEQRVPPALKPDADGRGLRDSWFSGAYLLETVPTALAIVAQYLDSPREGILEAVNRTWDNDTIASLVASAFGARYGLDAFDRRWIRRSAQQAQRGDADSMLAAIRRCVPFVPKLDEQLPRRF